MREELSKADLTTFNGMCHMLLDPNRSDIGPLLKHYDQVMKETRIKVPARGVLELDQ